MNTLVFCHYFSRKAPYFFVIQLSSNLNLWYMLSSYINLFQKRTNPDKAWNTNLILLKPLLPKSNISPLPSLLSNLQGLLSSTHPLTTPKKIYIQCQPRVIFRSFRSVRPFQIALQQLGTGLQFLTELTFQRRPIHPSTQASQVLINDQWALSWRIRIKHVTDQLKGSGCERSL